MSSGTRPRDVPASGHVVLHAVIGAPILAMIYAILTVFVPNLLVYQQNPHFVSPLALLPVYLLAAGSMGVVAGLLAGGLSALGLHVFRPTNRGVRAGLVALGPVVAMIAMYVVFFRFDHRSSGMAEMLAVGAVAVAWLVSVDMLKLRSRRR